MKGRFAHTSESEKPGLGIIPEAFNSVDMAFAMDEFILSMVETEGFFTSQIDESILPSPAIRMDDTFKSHTSSNNRVQRGSSAIRDNFCIHLPVAFEEAKDNSFSKGSTTSFAFYPPGAEEAYVNINLYRKRRLSFAELSNSLPNFIEVTVNRVSVKAGNLSNLGGVQVL